MSYTEEWSERAKQDLSDMTGQLLERWSEKQALVFIEKVHAAVGLILVHPEIGRPSAKKVNLRKLVISRQNSLIYCIKPGKTIRIVTLLDNRSGSTKI